MTSEQRTTDGNAKLALAAMTIAGSVILVDQTAVPLATPDIVRDLGADASLSSWVLTANLLPLAAFMVVGGRLGDLFGLRRVFLIGAFVFLTSTLIAIASNSIEMLIFARVVQGCGAALMMPNTVAIVSQTFPVERRGSALGVLAGGTAFFASLGPVLGGTLAQADWRLIFAFNAALTLITIGLTLRSVERFAGRAGPTVDYSGLIAFALGIVGVVFGLGQLSAKESALATYGPIVIGAIFLAIFVRIELRKSEPLVKLNLLRERNFLAANISQMIAGAIELGLGFLLPFQLLLVIGVDPVTAGIALLPASLPIILAGPLAGRAYDKFSGRGPMTVGYLILAASGVALAVGTGESTVGALIPGLVLQGVGLGIVLTINDPVGLSAVPEEDSGQAAGLINTSEQLGGAIGIAAFLAIELNVYRSKLYEKLASSGIEPTPGESAEVKRYLLEVEEKGAAHVSRSEVVDAVTGVLHQAHVTGFEAAFYSAGAIALFGAVISWVLIRPGPPLGIEVRSRRMRWVIAGLRVGRTE